jgi:hypothetical protein
MSAICCLEPALAARRGGHSRLQIGKDTSPRHCSGFGIALVATVFAYPGNYSSRPTFVHNFSNGLWVAAALSMIGVPIALAARAGPRRNGRRRPRSRTRRPSR